jgi:two-component system chemotaxis response regulator CheB
MNGSPQAQAETRARAVAGAAVGPRIKVLIVDDSALIRALLTSIVNAQPDMVAVGAAGDAYVAREMIKRLEPDVVTLDIEMPKMDGIDFLEKLMRLRPTRVVMVSTLTERGAEVTLRALELGAIDVVAKPKLDIARGLQSGSQEILDKIRFAATTPLRQPALSPSTALASSMGSVATTTVATPARVQLRASTEKLLVIGASTGGTEALLALLRVLPVDAPGIVIVQHMPEKFTTQFAARLDTLCAIRVKEAASGDTVMRGQALIAPGNHHLLLKRSGARYYVEVTDGPLVNRHRPAVDVLFRSTARYAGANAVGVILTGMGDDGARGMLEMKQAGAYTVAQDEASCVVFGMPAEAIKHGGVDRVLPLDRIAGEVVTRCR